MRHHLPVFERGGIDRALGAKLVLRKKILRVRYTAHGILMLAEAPALREKPSDVLVRIAEAGEFPIEHSRKTAVVDEIIAGAVIAMDEGGLLASGRIAFAPAQAPFEHRIRLREGIEIAAITRDVLVSKRSLQKRRGAARHPNRVNACKIGCELACETAPVRHKRRIARNPVARRDARQSLHQKKCAAGN